MFQSIFVIYLEIRNDNIISEYYPFKGFLAPIDYALLCWSFIFHPRINLSKIDGNETVVSGSLWSKGGGEKSVSCNILTYCWIIYLLTITLLKAGRKKISPLLFFFMFLTFWVLFHLAGKIFEKIADFNVGWIIH